MKLKETTHKQTPFLNLRESKPEKLDISFTKIIDDLNFGLPASSSNNINDKTKVQKLVKTLMHIREQKPHELIQTPKQQQIGGCEKCDIKKWQFKELKIKNFLEQTAQSQIFIVRAGDSRIFGSINNNCFFIHCIEYTLGDIYNH
ncbi:hypothetical protein [Campylobacter sp. RM9328]|uniref:hypothetical protein n=1 Tax=Campylobacter sp. RM9328 TaxID=1705720 RepID=UPI0014743B9B|nr:hypothetical protein [Campylobacter sp. RM9328]